MKLTTKGPQPDSGGIMASTFSWAMIARGDRVQMLKRETHMQSGDIKKSQSIVRHGTTPVKNHVLDDGRAQNSLSKSDASSMEAHDTSSNTSNDGIEVKTASKNANTEDTTNIYNPYAIYYSSESDYSDDADYVDDLNDLPVRNDELYVDAVIGVKAFFLHLVPLSNFQGSSPKIFVDCEGRNLSRNGTLSLLQIRLLPQERTWIFDVTVLKDAVFDTTSSSGFSIRCLLESSTTLKAFWDARNDSDALYKHYNIKLQGVIDIQLMEVATRPGANVRLWGLADCIAREAVASGHMTGEELQKWLRIKRTGKKYFGNAKGINPLGYGVFDTRPLPPLARAYAGQDTTYMPMLFDVYAARLRKQAGRMKLVHRACMQRIRASQLPEYQPAGFTKTFSPRILRNAPNA